LIDDRAEDVAIYAKMLWRDRGAARCLMIPGITTSTPVGTTSSVGSRAAKLGTVLVNDAQ
jgi:hypothetical protein